MTGLERRLLRLEAAQGGRSLQHFSDADLDARLRAELATWMAEAPGACPADVRAEVAAFLGAPDVEDASP